MGRDRASMRALYNFSIKLQRLMLVPTPVKAHKNMGREGGHIRGWRPKTLAIPMKNCRQNGHALRVVSILTPLLETMNGNVSINKVLGTSVPFSKDMSDKKVQDSSYMNLVVLMIS